MTALDDALWPRAALPRRPMLGAVLDALTVPSAGDPLPSFWCATGLPTVTIDRGNVIVVGSPHHSVRYPWIDASPAEAWEMLDARGLIPASYVGRFACSTCGGRGYSDSPTPFGETVSHPCYDCAGAGHRPHPPTVAALASWASLGFAAGDDGSPGILGTEELMSELGSGTPTRWRVIPVTNIPTEYFRNEAARRLNAAGFGWSGAARYRTLYVPPLGLVTP